MFSHALLLLAQVSGAVGVPGHVHQHVQGMRSAADANLNACDWFPT